ncbi:MAG: hypothetical protein WD872_16755, partial [Pirellulaceae bacterium]
AAQVQSHLRSIPALTRNVSVAKNPNGTFTITFTNALAGIDVGPLQATLSPTPTVPTIGTGTQGGPNNVRVSEVQQLTLNNSGGQARMEFSGVLGTFESLFFDSSSTTAAQILLHLNTIPALNGNVEVTGNPGGPFLIKFVNALAGVNIPDFPAAGSLRGVGSPGNPNPLVSTNIQGVTLTPTLNEAQSLTLTGSGSPVTLLFNGSAGTAATRFLDLSSTTAAQVLNHLNSIPALTGNVTVNGNPGGPFSITFVNALAGTPVSELT